jgi:hypothetical protein
VLYLFAEAQAETTSGYQVTWVKGQSGNPAGRPKGSKHKLQTHFWSYLHRTWKERGAEALRWVAENDPSTFVRVCASLMLKEETAKQIEHAIEVTSAIRTSVAPNGESQNRMEPWGPYAVPKAGRYPEKHSFRS